jgi:hypothetical protein
MSTTLKPFGLKPSFHPSGLDRSTPFAGTNSYVTGTPNFSATNGLSAGQAFYQYQPVAVSTAGGLTIASSTTDRLIGSFDGVEFTDSQGRRSVAKWISYEALAASTQVVFWIFSDPALVYEIQAVGSVANTAIGKGFNFSATTGYRPVDGVTIGVSGGAGFSTCGLNPTAVATGAQGQVKVVGLGREVAYPTGELNAWGDTNTIVQVQIANSQLVAPSISVAYA